MTNAKKISENQELFRPEDFIAKDEKGELISPEAEDVTEEDLEEESEQSYDEGVEAGLEAASATDWRSEAILDKREDTRTRLAIIYTISTFLVFLMGMILAIVDGILQNESITSKLAEIIPLISGVFLGTLGFVLGYYFRKGDD